MKRETFNIALYADEQTETDVRSLLDECENVSLIPLKRGDLIKQPRWDLLVVSLHQWKKEISPNEEHEASHLLQDCAVLAISYDSIRHTSGTLKSLNANTVFQFPGESAKFFKAVY